MNTSMYNPGVCVVDFYLCMLLLTGVHLDNESGVSTQIWGWLVFGVSRRASTPIFQKQQKYNKERSMKIVPLVSDQWSML